MKPLKEFIIPFVGLKLGKHHFDYHIGETFFEYFEYDDFLKKLGNLKGFSKVCRSKSEILGSEQVLLIKHDVEANIPKAVKLADLKL